MTAKSTKIMGSLQYMAPERFEAITSPGVDVYAAGLIAWELLAGRPACEHDTPTGAMKWHVMKGAPPIETTVPDAPPWLAAAITRMVDIDPDQRVATADEALALLRHEARGERSASSGASASSPPQTQWIPETRAEAAPPGPPTPLRVEPVAPPPPSNPPARRRSPGVIIGLVSVLALIAVVGVVGIVGAAGAGAGAWLWLGSVDPDDTDPPAVVPTEIIDPTDAPDTDAPDTDSITETPPEDPPPTTSAEDERRALQQRREQATDLRRRGWKAIDSNTGESPSELFSKAMQLEPTDPEAQLGLGVALAEDGDPRGRTLICGAMAQGRSKLGALRGTAKEAFEVFRDRPLWCADETPGTRARPDATTGPGLLALGWQQYRSRRSRTRR